MSATDKPLESVETSAKSNGKGDPGGIVATCVPLESCTDTGNANRFVRLFGGQVLYCPAERLWYCHDRVRWAPDHLLFVEDAIGQVALSIFEDAARASDVKEAREIAKWASHSLSAAARKAALECVRSDPRIVVQPSDFDRDGWLLNCLNGTLDLHVETGGLRAHDPADRIRKLAPVVYDPEARSDLWERVLAEATGGDVEYQRHLRRFLGSSLTADTEAELAAIALGPTETTKSTVLGAIRKAMGDYAADVKPDTFYLRDRVGGTRDDLLRLEGVRLVLIGEADRHKRMDEGLLKSFVSGETIPARGVYRRDQDLRPVAKVVYHTNELPRMTDDDDAVWRRALIWPFDHRPETIDTSVKPELLDLGVSGPAVLRWLVEGCRAWQIDGGAKKGLGEPTAVQQAKRATRSSMDPLLDYFDEGCDFDENLWCSRSSLRKSYLEWAKQAGVRRPIGAKDFAGRVRVRNCSDETGTEGGRGVDGWRGVAPRGGSS
jgi:putative DNA primase/helicase